MGNHHSHGSHSTRSHGHEDSKRREATALRRHSEGSKKTNIVCLERLFQKLELTADEDNSHPGELTRITFENVFHGPLKLFGKLLYRQMVAHGSGHGHGKNGHIKDRITLEQFVKAGKELLQMFDEVAQHKYYFQLFAEGKDHLEKEDGLTMVNISYALTLSSSMIPYSRNIQDEKVFEAMVQSLFNLQSSLSYSDLEKWLNHHCPHMFAGVHNWVYTILTGSKVPTELETTRFPQLERIGEGTHCMSMGMLWALSASLPYIYTHSEKEGGESSTGTKNPLLTSFQFLMKLARLSRCQSWTLLYDSNDHGLSMNRFLNHVSSYNGPTITLASFEGRNVYCIACDQPWRDDAKKFGGKDTVLLQITPVYRVVQSDGPMVLWNQIEREKPRGISIGKEGSTEVLKIPQEFDNIKHYGVDCELITVEMWGCAGTEIRKAQMQQKKWERKDIEKHQQRKLHMDVNWDENPDKQILSWGGVEVNHQYSREGGL